MLVRHAIVAFAFVHFAFELSECDSIRELSIDAFRVQFLYSTLQKVQSLNVLRSLTGRFCV